MHADPPAIAAECKHTCKDKEACRHSCCKQHLPVATQLKLKQRLVTASAPTPECKHTCLDKLACGHQCCKRHFSRDLAADPEKPQPPANLQIIAQTGRRPRHTPDKQLPRQDRAATRTAMLQVHGKSVPAKQVAQDRSSEAKLNYHFFVYDLESTGTFVYKHDVFVGLKALGTLVQLVCMLWAVYSKPCLNSATAVSTPFPMLQAFHQLVTA